MELALEETPHHKPGMHQNRGNDAIVAAHHLETLLERSLVITAPTCRHPDSW